jgi:hypothetical protein
MERFPPESDEVSVTRMGLRTGGWIGYSDDAVFIDRGDDERIKIAHDNVTQISLNTFEWDLGIMSLLLIGVGTYVAVTRNPAVGIAFGAIGAWSAYRTYGKRYELRIRVDGEAKPVSLYPHQPGDCLDRLIDVCGLEERG